MKKINKNSLDIVQDNIKRLQLEFPEIFTEGKIDIEKLNEELGEFVSEKNERYNFTWNGKSEAKKLSLTPSSGTLRLCKEDSKNIDTTQNLYIEGDNLEVLKLLQKSYHKKVKMIYIDPPYNTGKDFVYKDNFKNNIKNYLEITGQVDDEGNKLSINSDTGGRYHSDWLNMIYPRLKLARNLLKDDGVIFISIGEDEVSNLEKVCNEIYGEDNKIGFITRVQKKGSDLGNFFSPTSDYILAYAKNSLKLNGFKIGIDESKFKKIEEKGDRKGELYEDSKSLYQSSLSDLRKGQKYFIECPDGSKVIPPCIIFDEVQREGEKRWRWSKERYLKDAHLLVFKKTKSSPLLDENGKQSIWNVYTKRYLKDAQEKGNVPSNLFTDFLNSKATSSLKKLDLSFSFSKPKELINYLIEITNTRNEIILDFFSGSGTTADSVIEMNSNKSISNRFILVQLPEFIENNNVVDKSKFNNICEVGKERIRRAGEKILEESDKDLSNLDVGFKVLRLDSSNIKTWDTDYEDLEQNLLDAVDNIKEDRTNEDLLYEILLKYGLDLTLPIEELTINDKKVFNIGFGALIVCLDSDIDTNTVEQIAQLKKQYEEDYGLEDMKVVFKDNGFKDAVVKTNSLQILKQHSINEVVSI